MTQIAETSIEAYRQVQPRLPRSRATVYQSIADATDRGFDMTNMEIAQLLKWSINRVTPRVKELRDRGLVEKACKRRCGVTGRRAFAWRRKP